MIHPTAAIHPTARILSDDIQIGPYCRIEAGVRILAPEKFHLGRCGSIGQGTQIECWQFVCGTNLFMKQQVIVGGGGGLSSQESVAIFGHDVFVGEYTVINTSCRVSIGSLTGLGAHVGLWTHGVYPSAVEGFPAKFAPVAIGEKCWITGNTQVLPGVTIGDRVVVGMMSLVNKDLPAGCLAGGVPAKVLREDAYPEGMRNPGVVQEIHARYEASLRWRGIMATVDRRGLWELRVTDSDGGTDVVFDLNNLTAVGHMGPVGEDLRNFLRRWGIRIDTGRPYMAIPHPAVVRLLKRPGMEAVVSRSLRGMDRSGREPELVDEEKRSQR